MPPQKNKENKVIEDQTVDMKLWDQMVDLHRSLKAAKPEERSELSRRYAVAITEFEKAIGFFYLMVVQEFEG